MLFKRMIYLLVFVVGIFCLFEIIYADDEYKIGDTISYKGIDFYVIKNSSSDDNVLTIIKSEPLTTEEVNRYGKAGTEDSHINMHCTTDLTDPHYQTSYDIEGYGSMAYYTNSDTCGVNGLKVDYSYCATDYSQSEIKYVVDAWAEENLDLDDLIVDSSGYSVRLITYDEFSSLGYSSSSGSLIS